MLLPVGVFPRAFGTPLGSGCPANPPPPSGGGPLPPDRGGRYQTVRRPSSGVLSKCLPALTKKLAPRPAEESLGSSGKGEAAAPNDSKDLNPRTRRRRRERRRRQ